MQGGRSASAVESAKEAAANVGASAWAGKEKAKAVVQEKAAKARAHDPAGKAAADARMEGRVRGVEAAKRDAMRRNAAAKERASAAEHHPTPLGVGAATAAAPAPTPAGVHVLDGSAAADGRTAVPAGAGTVAAPRHDAAGSAIPEENEEKRPRKWAPPLEGWTMMNFDATVFVESKAMRIGLVIRDHSGNILAACRQEIDGITEPKFAEATAFRHAVHFMSTSIQSSDDASDCLSVVQKLQSAGKNHTQVVVLV